MGVIVLFKLKILYGNKSEYIYNKKKFFFINLSVNDIFKLRIFNLTWYL